MKVFHYTRINNWEEIRNGSWESNNIPGLGAGRRIGREDKEAFNTGAVFALQEPLPHAWTHNSDFIKIWDFLRRQIGNILLEIDIDPNRDPVYILERAHMEGFLYKEKDGIPKKYLHESRKKSERAYMASKIPMLDYLESKGGEYSLPEVIITEHIPLERVTISKQQPLLEADLIMYTGKWRERIIDQIGKIPELKSWL